MPALRTCTVTANGLRFALDEAGDGDRVALCLHGFPQSRRCWRHQLPALADLGWRAVAPDLRGYGGSSRPAAKAAYRLGRLVDDVEALFAALGARRRLLMGHDWGGVIAWATAIRRPALLDGLVIVNAPHPAVFARVLRAGWRQRLRSWYALAFQVPWLPERLLAARQGWLVGQALTRSARGADTFPSEMLAHYRAQAAAPGAMRAMLAYYRANRPWAAPGDASRVDAPTLLLWGERDTALGPELVAPTAGYVPDLVIRRFPEASHWLPEEAPAAVNAALTAWLGERGLGR